MKRGELNFYVSGVHFNEAFHIMHFNCGILLLWKSEHMVPLISLVEFRMSSLIMQIKIKFSTCG